MISIYLHFYWFINNNNNKTYIYRFIKKIHFLNKINIKQPGMKSRWMKKNHYKILNKHLFSINKSDNFFFFFL